MVGKTATERPTDTQKCTTCYEMEKEKDAVGKNNGKLMDCEATKGVTSTCVLPNERRRNCKSSACGRLEKGEGIEQGKERIPEQE